MPLSFSLLSENAYKAAPQEVKNCFIQYRELGTTVEAPGWG